MTNKGRHNVRSVTFEAKTDGKKIKNLKVTPETKTSNVRPDFMQPSGRGMKTSPSFSTLSRLERQKIVLWRRPFKTLNYFIRETILIVFENLVNLLSNRLLIASSSTLLLLTYLVYIIPGPHSTLVAYLERKFAWSIYWVFLGILSSVGLGTGLHTFLLYLGPHIASVTLAAYECDSLLFPEPPYPDQIVCPYSSTNHQSLNHTSNTIGNGTTLHNDDLSIDLAIGNLAASSVISLWSIMSKVRLEAFMWGAGTALGELPPYFMARAARLSGDEPDDEEYREFMAFMHEQEMEKNGGQLPEHHDLWSRLKLSMQKLIEKVGFFGILLCASVPNPLFDLAGITCGHFLVPFWTFFGATLLGKAVIKMHIQKLFVILAFSEHHVERCVAALKRIPKLGPYLQSPFKQMLVQQKMRFHRRPVNATDPSSSLPSTDVTKGGIFPRLFEALFVVMVAYFLVSLINSLAQNYDKRLFQKRKQKDAELKSQ